MLRQLRGWLRALVLDETTWAMIDQRIMQLSWGKREEESNG